MCSPQGRDKKDYLYQGWYGHRATRTLLVIREEKSEQLSHKTWGYLLKLNAPLENSPLGTQLVGMLCTCSTKDTRMLVCVFTTIKVWRYPINNVNFTVFTQ